MSDESTGPWPIAPAFCPYKPFPTVNDLVRLDQIPKFPQLSPEEITMYYERGVFLWDVLAHNREDSEPYGQAFVELVGLSLLLMDGMKEFERLEYGAYVRACKHESEELRLRNLAKGRDTTHNDAINKLQSQLVEFNSDLRLRVDAFKLFLPRQLSANDLERRILEARLQYGNAIKEMDSSQKEIDALADARIARQKAGKFLSDVELMEYNSKLAALNNRFNRATLILCNARLESEVQMKNGGKLCEKPPWPQE